MHVLTKVLVALTALASVALATLTMAYAVNADRIVNELRTERAATAHAKAALDIQAGEASTRLEAERDVSQDLSAKLNDTLDRLRGVQVELAKVEGEKSEAERARAAIQGELGNLATSVQTFVQLTSSLTSENDGLRDRFLRQNEELIQLADRLNDAESQRSVLDATVRQLELQLRAAQDSGAFGSLRGARHAGAIQGEVRDVALDPGSDKTLVELNLGANDGIKPGTMLRVTRNDNWVANLRAMSTDLNVSTAEVTLGGKVSAGDKVEIQ